jgi:hypothetical protein
MSTLLSFVSDVATVMLGMHLYFKISDAYRRYDDRKRWQNF